MMQEFSYSLLEIKAMFRSTVYRGNPRDGFHFQQKTMTKESEQMKTKTFCSGSEKSRVDWHKSRTRKN